MARVLLIEFENGIEVYEDGTFRCDFWNADDYSQWRIIDGKWQYKHRGMVDFADQSDEKKSRQDARQVEEAIAKIVEDNLLL